MIVLVSNIFGVELQLHDNGIGPNVLIAIMITGTEPLLSIA